jgi:hypothetical protein
MEKVVIRRAARKKNSRPQMPSTVEDQPFDFRQVSFIDRARLRRQFRTVKPFLGFGLLQTQKIQAVPYPPP